MSGQLESTCEGPRTTSQLIAVTRTSTYISHSQVLPVRLSREAHPRMWRHQSSEDAERAGEGVPEPT